MKYPEVLVALRMAFDGREGFVADDMLHLARILGRDLRIDAEICQKGRQKCVPLVNLLRDRTAGVGQGQKPRILKGLPRGSRWAC